MLVRTKDAVVDYEQDTDGIFKFTEGGPLLLLDGDPIAYSSAAACDSSEHHIKLNGSSIYTVQGGITELYSALGFTDYRDFNMMLDKNPQIIYEKVVTSDNPKNMLHTVKAQIRKIIKRVGAGSVKIYLTDGATNFRIVDDIATVLKYKGNRSSESKPQMLGKARDYMMEELGAIMCTGWEADDELAIEHRKSWKDAMSEASMFYIDKTVSQEQVEKKAMELSKTVLCTIDKDIKMVAGKFLNPDQDIGIEEIYPLGHLYLEVKGSGKKLRFNGLKGFYAQLLLGDNCDNIPSVYFCGDTRVYEVLKDCNNEESLFKETLREIYRGFHREHLKSLDAEIMNRVDLAIESGLHGKDNPSNRSKVKKNIKDKFDANVSFIDKSYYHWSCYEENEDGTVSRNLKVGEHEVLTLTPINYMLEVAHLIYMLETYPNKDGDHLWKIPCQKWVDDVVSEFEGENLMRIPMGWDL